MHSLPQMRLSQGAREVQEDLRMQRPWQMGQSRWDTRWGCNQQGASVQHGTCPNTASWWGSSEPGRARGMTAERRDKGDHAVLGL